MFVKIYKYKINSTKVEEYIRIQREAEKIYKKFIDKETTHLQSKEDPSTWLEIHWYAEENQYLQSIKVINEQDEIQKLYEQFLSVLISKEVLEDDFQKIMIVENFTKN